MLFNVALFTCLLLAPAVLAVPSALAGASVARRRVKYNPEWAGSIVTSNGNFSWAMGEFIVPPISGVAGASAAAWVGIDGTTCQSTMFLVGVDFTISSDGQHEYVAWYQWPNNRNTLSDINISAGDLIRLTVIAFSPTFGKVRIDNLSNDKMVEEYQTFDTPICALSAEWIIENMNYRTVGTYPPLANFTTVAFDNAMAGGSGGIFNGSDGDLIDILQGNVAQTSTSASGWSVTIEYDLTALGN